MFTDQTTFMLNQLSCPINVHIYNNNKELPQFFFYPLLECPLFDIYAEWS